MHSALHFCCVRSAKRPLLVCRSHPWCSAIAVLRGAHIHPCMHPLLHHTNRRNLLGVLGMGCYCPLTWSTVAASVFMCEEWGGYMSVKRLIRAAHLAPMEPTFMYNYLDALRCGDVADMCCMSQHSTAQLRSHSCSYGR
jgi:hypothetical protein